MTRLSFVSVLLTYVTLTAAVLAPAAAAETQKRPAMTPRPGGWMQRDNNFYRRGSQMPQLFNAGCPALTCCPIKPPLMS